MNEYLIIDQPVGAEWTFSLDPAAAPGSYTGTRTFQLDGQGLPFVDGGQYTVFAYHAETDTVLSDVVTFRTGPISTAVSDETSLPDLDAVARRGSATTRVLTVGGIQARSWPTASSAEFVFVERANADGTRALARYPIGLLQPGTVVAPRYRVLRHHQQRVGPVVPRYQLRGHYQPVSTATPTPGAPIGLVASRAAGNTPEVSLAWRLPDALGTAIQLQIQNADGTWGAITTLPAATTTAGVAPLNWGQTYRWRVRAIVGSADTPTFQSPWSNIASVRLNTYTVALGVYGAGQPPAFLSALAPGGELVRPGGAVNLGVLIRDRQGNPPTGEDFDRTVCYVTLPNGTRAGWDTPDTNAAASATPLFLFPRPDGFALPLGLYTLTVGLFQGTVPVGQFVLSTRLLAVPTAPISPSGLTVQRTGTGDALLTWTDNADNENYQTIEYREGTGAWVNLTVAGPNQTTSTIQGVNSPGVTYSFRVLAGNTVGESAPSNVAVLSPTAPANRPPIMPTFANQQAFVGEFFSYTLPVAVDPDGDAISYAMQGLTQGLAFAPTTRTVSGTPTGGATTLTTTVTATDALGAASSGGLLIAIAVRANRLPVPPTLPDRVSVSGVAVSIILPPFTDPDGDPLTYSAQSLPPGLTFDPATRGVSGTPAGTPTRVVTYAATDNRGGSFAASFEWRITAPANRAPVAPVLPRQTVAQNLAWNYTVPPFTDPDGDPLTYSASGLPAGLGFTPGSRAVSGIASAAGVYVATITANDGRGGVTSADLTIEVQAPQLVVTQVRARIIAHPSVARQNVVQVEATLNRAGETQWKLTLVANGSTPGWQVSSAWDRNTVSVVEFAYDKLGKPPANDQTMQVDVRPLSNPAAEKGPYLVGFGGTDLRDWEILTIANI